MSIPVLKSDNSCFRGFLQFFSIRKKRDISHIITIHVTFGPINFPRLSLVFTPNSTSSHKRSDASLTVANNSTALSEARISPLAHWLQSPVGAVARRMTTCCARLPTYSSWLRYILHIYIPRAVRRLAPSSVLVMSVMTPSSPNDTGSSSGDSGSSGSPNTGLYTLSCQ